jgi:hypothetical protein
MAPTATTRLDANLPFECSRANRVQGSNARPKTPYGNISDFLSNVGRFKIIESTLRGAASPFSSEQDHEADLLRGRAVRHGTLHDGAEDQDVSLTPCCATSANAHQCQRYSPPARVPFRCSCNTALDAIGVDYIELTSPAASEQSRKDCETICKLGLKAKILTHVRCNMNDAKLAVETGVDGLDIVIGTSPQLREHSHGKDMDWIKKSAIEVIEFVKSKGLEVRCTFRFPCLMLADPL